MVHADRCDPRKCGGSPAGERA
ncbi:MAG: hypothetical protein H8K03_15175 [Nitrospira sp.]